MQDMPENEAIKVMQDSRWLGLFCGDVISFFPVSGEAKIFNMHICKQALIFFHYYFFK